jgi:uncharacterized membrane protein
MRKSTIVVLGIILLSFIIGISLYPQMPDKMASHWNLQGKVNGYMPKFWGLFLLPLMLIGIASLFIIIPRIDPLQANIEKFRKYYDRFIILFSAFLLWIYLFTILWNLGFKFHISLALLPAFAILFYYIGILCENAKRNWFIGIRTPWTLSNEKVWEKTHKIGGKLFKIAGVIALLGVLFQSYALFFILMPVLLVASYTIIYSYFEYQKETK